MRNLRSFLVGSGVLVLGGLVLPLGASCSSSQAPASGGAAGNSGTAGTSGHGGSRGANGSHGSGGASGSAGTSCGPGCYAPAGCSYKITPPSTWAFTEFAVDKPTSSPGTPERVRLGLGGGTTMGQPDYADPTTSAVLTWETKAADTNAEVKIGTSMTSLTELHTGYTWTTSSLLGSPAYMHEAHICGLAPGKTYYYEVGGGTGKGVWSAVQSFTTVPSSGALKVGVYSDARETVSIWQTVHSRMKALGVNLHVISGDIVDLGPDETEWSQWLDAIWKDPSGSGFLTLGEQLMVPIAGNHEAESAMFYGNWSIPYTTEDTYAKTYASFNAGNTHFVMYDDSPAANNATAEATAQQAWLEADLQAADAHRSKVPFVVVLSHRCLYSTSTHGGDPDVTQARGILAPLYDKYHVDLAINGHDHDYERTNVLRAGSPPSKDPKVVAMAPSSAVLTNAGGPVYVVNGGAGADPYGVGSPASFQALSQQLCVGSGCAANTYEGCYATLDLEGSSLKLTAYGIKGASSTDDVIDSLTLTR